MRVRLAFLVHYIQFFRKLDLKLSTVLVLDQVGTCVFLNDFRGWILLIGDINYFGISEEIVKLLLRGYHPETVENSLIIFHKHWLEFLKTYVEIDWAFLDLVISYIGIVLKSLFNPTITDPAYISREVYLLLRVVLYNAQPHYWTVELLQVIEVDCLI